MATRSSVTTLLSIMIYDILFLFCLEGSSNKNNIFKRITVIITVTIGVLKSKK